jgi:hypothetical protein
LHGGAREHAFAVLHDARQLGRVDPVAFDPGPDREQVRVADRVLLARDPRTLQQLAFDQLEAFRHRCGHLALHRLYRRVDPMELRLRNLIRPEEFPYKVASGIVWDRSGFVESLTSACAGTFLAV